MSQLNNNSIKVDDESGTLLDRIAQTDGNLDAEELHRVIPNKDEFARFVQDLNLQTDPQAIAILQELELKQPENEMPEATVAFEDQPQQKAGAVGMIASEDKVTLRGARRSERRIGILCVNMDPVSRESLEALVAQTPGARVVDNVNRHVTPREVMRMLEQFQHRVCVIDFEEGEESARISQRIREGCDTGVAIFAASSRSHPDQIIAAMRSGCSEYLLKPFQPDQISHALAHVGAWHQGKLPGQKGRVLTLMGAKGGAGVTSLALHLALNLVQKQNQKVLLVDQHPALGDLALCLGLGRHQYSFYELVHNMDRLDADLLQGFLLQHSSGLHVLDSPEAIDAFSNTSSVAIEHTLAFLAENYQFVIVDCPPGLTEDTRAVIRQSDRLAIVITPELPAIHNAIRSIQYLTGSHYPAENIDIVLNRYSRKNPLTEREIEASLHRSIAVKVPNDYDVIVNAINAGTPIDLARKSDLAAAFDAWAHRLLANEAPGDKARQGSAWAVDKHG